MSLKDYNKKRNFKKTSEPAGTNSPKPKKTAKSELEFVIQKHDASRLHFDFRLELNGVLKSWAVPKGPSLNPKDKRLAVQVEDHPYDYRTFEGTIPKGEYGGGTVMLWDRGVWIPEGEDPEKQFKNGSLKFRLEGDRLRGKWALVRIKPRGGESDDKNWLLIKEKDEYVEDRDIVSEELTSIASSRTMDRIAREETGPASDGSQNNVPDSSFLGNINKITGAKKAVMPKTFKPQLATLSDYVPTGKEWVHEIKFDGYRFLAFLDKGKVCLITRNGHDWSSKFPDVVKSLERLPVEQAIVDGELVALDQDGHSNFQLLQNSLKGSDNPKLAYYLFDIIYLNGYRLTEASLEVRKTLLESLFEKTDKDSLVRYSKHFTQAGKTVWSKACEMGIEGIISKKLDAPYLEKRSSSWIKVKCVNRQEFVIGGFTKPSGNRTGLGALLVGLYNSDTNKLTYKGKVGTGFTDASLRDLKNKLDNLAVKSTPFDNPPSGAWTRSVTWVKPGAIAEISYANLTSEGILRHSVFHGLREDKSAAEVTGEIVMELDEKKTARAKKKTSSEHKSKTRGKANPHLTSPDRVLYPEMGVTKKDLSEYYIAVEKYIMPYLHHRPLTLVRCPAGRSKPCFYQRHLLKNAVTDGLAEIEITGNKGNKETYFYVTSAVGLQSMVQNSTLELHGWQCAVDDVDKPDRIVFDLDPDEGIEWKTITAAAVELKEILEQCGFTPFVMTTGGKGIHVVVPLQPYAGWDEVKEFAETVAGYLAGSQPKKYTATMSKAKRKGKIFIDYFRNNHSATAIMPYSTRARSGATIATPIRWSELTKVDPKKFTIKSIPKRLAQLKSDPWKGFFDEGKRLDMEAVLAYIKGE